MATYDITTTAMNSVQLENDDILNCPYTGQQQQITLAPGKYKLECWGAASNKPSSNPGKGGYAKGILELQNETTFYIYVGGVPTASSGWYTGGWNGGGGSRGGTGDSGGGGGATDICLVPSSLTIDSYYRSIRSDESYKSRIIVAGGAGGGYSTSSQDQRAGGYCPGKATSTTSYIGGMTAAGTIHSTSCEVIGGFGYGSSSNYSGDDHSGGGGGWYGGGSQGDSYGGGGSSFVWSAAHESYIPSGYSVDSSLQMTDVQCIYGNASMIQPNGSSTTGHAGAGHARITVIEIVSGDYEIISNLINCVSNNQLKAVNEGDNYLAVLSSADISYSMNEADIIIKMNNIDITSQVYDKLTYTINIPNINGNIEIIASARLRKYIDLRKIDIFPQPDFLINTKVIAKDASMKYKDSNESINSLSIAPINNLPIQSNELVYTGKEITASFNNYDTQKMLIYDNVEIDAGEYNAKFVLNTDDYVIAWPDGDIDSKSIPFVINKREGELTLNGVPQIVTLGKTSTIQITTNSTGNISILNLNPDIVNAIYSDNVITLTWVGNGEATIIVNLDADNNNTASTYSFSVVATDWNYPYYTSLTNLVIPQVFTVGEQEDILSIE